MSDTSNRSAQAITRVSEGFSKAFVKTSRGTFHIRRYGEGGTPLLLLHGFPQSSECWNEVAPRLSSARDVICMDLVGYGLSDAPAGGLNHLRYSKLEMAADCLEVMSDLGIERFDVAGHDRGALVAMRLALNSDRIERLILLDNLPTFVLWDRIATDPTFIPHWRAIAGPDGEDLLTAEWLEELMRDHVPSRSLNAFSPQAMHHYRRSWQDPARIHAFCEDYRAGAGPDVELDRADFAEGRRITIPSLVIWGRDFLGLAGEKPIAVWKRTFAPEIEGAEVSGGHFNPEEAPEETADAIARFLAR
ncbi:haloacetate dehalogenase [Rhizobium sp. NFR07]|uniref:alpha/beta fold hydrolase n=1 Tax=Rhizobium sp. NFR07 TaxID=1566262 RepID=UPI0008E89650|nr:alpha/beta hydrolase [Rhizobium sp. NFR07]SFB55246.1 haloacetate dehalogenase [Rhizobium sp. NFR07]